LSSMRRVLMNSLELHLEVHRYETNYSNREAI
jgi:hypothetical protein